MLSIALGLAWLVLSPLCLWIVFRGRVTARIGALLTLAALEGATVVLSPGHEASDVVAHDVPAPPRPIAAQCPARAPVPQTARLARDHQRLELFWSARPDECQTAKVVLRPKGRQLRVWVHEGPWDSRPKGARTVPVHVVGDTAWLRMAIEVPQRTRYQPVDGRTGRDIADRQDP
ncbi:hypothetical protein [Nonomuraea sp. NPDC003804]|uniref:hypothetical protein n=1 Tax=Nonomuraea sp. NPDC003804 TaxID=3154547 RepID=UPI0033AFF1E9